MSDKKEYMKEYYKKNKAKRLEYAKQYHENNKEKINQYRKTPARKKSQTIANWRFMGVIETDQYTFDELYETYLYHPDCEECGVTLTTGRYTTKTTKCLDHDHATGIFRNILCHCCNSKRR